MGSGHHDFFGATISRADIILRVEGHRIWLSKPIYAHLNRYYVPALSLSAQLGGIVKVVEDTIHVKFHQKPMVVIDTKATTHQGYIHRHEFYLSLYDACKIFGFISFWDYKSMTIALYPKEEVQKEKAPPKEGRSALIRFEDITAGGSYLDSDHLAKLRVIGDYMSQERFPFHIAWISRFMNPLQGIDNNLLTNFNMQNADFLFTLDYLIACGGCLGLHGYTHQYENEISAEGTEFSADRNTDPEIVRSRAQAAMNTAVKLQLPYSFFESPHYASTMEQQSIFEEYFDVMYECYVGIWGTQTVMSQRNQRTIYVPTPLGYVEEAQGALEAMLGRIHDVGESTLASLFYHPTIEFDSITIQKRVGDRPSITYALESPLHQIIAAIYEKGLSPCWVTDILEEMTK